MEEEKSIKIIAFQGASHRYKEYEKEDPLIIYGHVGIKFEDDPLIYGFHPTNKTVEIMGGIRIFREKMEAGIPVPGIFQNDTEIFLRTYVLTALRSREFLANDPHRLEVYFTNFSYDMKVYSDIKAKLDLWYTDKKSFPYLFSPIKEADSFDNCATIQRQLGMPIPAFNEHQGTLGKYIRFFKEYGELWKPEEGNP